MAPAPTAKPKILASYCKEIAEQANLPEAQVRLVCELFLKGILDQLRAGIPFGSWMVNMTPEPLPAAKAPGTNAKPPASLSVTVSPAAGFSDDKFQKQVLVRLKA